MIPADQIADVIAGRSRFALLEGEALEVLRCIPSATIGALITDPPYSSGGFTRGDRTGDPKKKYSKLGYAEHIPGFSGDNRDQRGFAYWCALWLSEALRVTIPGGPLVHFSDWRQLPTATDSIQAGGWVWRGIWVWAKPAARPQRGRFSASCEFAAWGTNGPALNLPEVGCLPGHLVAGYPQGANRVHLTQKPDAVMDEVVRIAPPGSVVLDPFAGSASTGTAALRRGLRFIGVERDPGYAAIAHDRLAAELERLDAQPDLFPLEVAS